MSEHISISTAQLRVLQAEYTRLKKDDDARTHGPNGEIYYDTREGRIAWACACLGVRIETFNQLSTKQGEYLIDVLKKSHTSTKLDTFIRAEFARMGVEYPEAYFQAMLAKGNIWKYGGRSLDTLNRYQKCALARLLSSRGASPARDSRRRPSSPPARRVSAEQQGLWPGY